MTPDSKTRKISPQEGLAKIYRYCAYQERSHQEVKEKLFDYGLYPDAVNEILSRLITEGFLNEERFARAFAGGKFRMQKWGRNKIVHALQAHGLTKNCIQRGLQEIDNPNYWRTLKELIAKKLDQTAEENRYKKRDRVARFAIGKGYEPELVWEVVKDLLPEH
jgi:regulatory protein